MLFSRLHILPIAAAALTLLACQTLVLGQCSVGDAACHCKLVGGSWLTTPTVIVPTCRKSVDTKGGNKRIVDIYFPRNIGAAGVSFRPWVHLHGVMWSKWWLDGHAEWQQLAKRWTPPMGGNADAWRMNVLTGKPITGDSKTNNTQSGLVKQEGYILLVPQGTGDVTSGQMFNSIFWPCMGRTTQPQPHCVDKSVDDVAFVAGILTNMQQLLQGVPIKKRAMISGYSNGGMLLQTLLCQRPSLANNLSGVALLGTMLGSDFASSSCGRRLPRRLPLLWVHGVKDSVLPYQPGGSSMGVKALGAEAATRLWAQRMDCPGSSSSSKVQPVFSDAANGVTCLNLCGGSSDQPTAVLCSVAGAGHSLWDQPGPGYTAGLALWAFGAFKGTPQRVQ